MKKLLATTALLATLAFTAMPASAMGIFPWWPTDAQIQAAAVQACQFEPDAATIAQVLNANGSWMTAFDVAKAICTALTGTTPTAAAPGTEVTKTVVIHGTTVVIHGVYTASK